MAQSRPPLARMYRIDEQLRAGRYPNCTGLARHFQVNAKTIQRDIDYMRLMLGAPIAYDQKQRGFHYEGDWRFLPSMFLDEREAKALMATKKVLSQYVGTPYYQEIGRALDKVLQYLPDTLPEGGFFDVYSFARPSSEQPESSIFTTLEDAISQHLKVHITYDALTTGEQSKRIVRPYRLHYADDTWYLIGHCELRDEARAFVLRRMRKVKLLENQPFTPDPGFNPDAYLDRMFRFISGGHDKSIRIRFSPRQSAWIRERRWHQSQQIEENSDGSIDLVLNVSALDAVRSWVMQYGGDAEVIEPEELRSMVLREAATIVGMYGSGNGSGEN